MWLLGFKLIRVSKIGLRGCFWWSTFYTEPCTTLTYTAFWNTISLLLLTHKLIQFNNRTPSINIMAILVDVCPRCRLNSTRVMYLSMSSAGAHPHVCKCLTLTKSCSLLLSSKETKLLTSINIEFNSCLFCWYNRGPFKNFIRKLWEPLL